MAVHTLGIKGEQARTGGQCCTHYISPAVLDLIVHLFTNRSFTKVGLG